MRIKRAIILLGVSAVLLSGASCSYFESSQDPNPIPAPLPQPTPTILKTETIPPVTSQTDPVEIAGFQVRRYTNPTYGYSFLYPVNWEMNIESDTDINITTTKQGALISLHVTPNCANTGLADFLSTHLDTYSKYINGFVLIAKSSVTNTDYGSKIEIVDKYDVQGITKEKWLFAKSKETIFSLVCASSEGGFDYFYSELFDGVIDSFQFIEE